MVPTRLAGETAGLGQLLANLPVACLSKRSWSNDANATATTASSSARFPLVVAHVRQAQRCVRLVLGESAVRARRASSNTLRPSSSCVVIGSAPQRFLVVGHCLLAKAIAIATDCRRGTLECVRVHRPGSLRAHGSLLGVRDKCGSDFLALPPVVPSWIAWLPSPSLRGRPRRPELGCPAVRSSIVTPSVPGPKISSWTFSRSFLHELQNVPPQVVRVDDVEGQCPAKNAGLVLQHLLLLLLLLLHSVIVGLVPGALRLSRVQLIAGFLFLWLASLLGLLACLYDPCFT